MNTYTSEDIRNIALLGHASSGKTELIEAILARAGVITSPGTVDRGNTVCDFESQEKQLGHSLETAICSFDHDNKHINLIDTPGYPDFIGRTISILPAVETAALVLDAQMGIEMVTQKIMEVAVTQGLCRMIIVNKIDANDIDLASLLSQIQSVFGDECLPINLPSDNGHSVVDCFFKPQTEATDFSTASQAHTEIIDQVVEVDEQLMEVYLEQGEDLSPKQLHDPFEKALREGHLIPICFVSARTGAGVDALIEIFSKLMPNPSEGNPPQFFKGEGTEEKVEVYPVEDRHAIAHVFKVNVDPFVGKMGIFRIHQGTIKNNSQLFIGDGRKPFKVGHLLSLQGKKHIEVPMGIPGDICAVSKIDDIHLDAVLHDSHDEDFYHLRPIDIPPPMHGLAIEPLRRGDEQKLSDTLHKLTVEDPSILIEHNVQANETVIRGMGELHLRIILERMKERYHVEVTSHPPSIAYKESIRAPAEGHHRHKKQTGGAGQFGEVFLRIEPLKNGEGFVFVNKVVGGAIPSQFIPAVEKGIRQIMESGAISGHPMQDIQVTVYDGKYHAVDSKEIAFVAAGKKAFLDAISKAKPIILEPVVKIQITAPNASMGDLTGDISGKRGRVNNTDTLSGGVITISAQIPLSEMENYHSTLKSITGGEGAYTIELSHYEPAPPDTQKKLIDGFRQHTDD